MRTKIGSTTLAVLLAIPLTIPAGTRTGAAPGPASLRAAFSQIRIDNFGRVNSSYYRGAQPSRADVADLAAIGIRTVIDLQQDGDGNEPEYVRQAGMTFYRIPMTTRRAPTADQLTKFLTLVTDPANLPVFVHCAGGRHRTGVMTAAYRMTADGWTADQAFAEMKQYKFGADFLHPEFKQFVYTFQAHPIAATPVLKFH